MINYIKNLIPIGYRNYLRYVKNLLERDKSSEINLSSTFNQIYKNNYWKGNESISGMASGIKETAELRKALQKFINNKKIKTILDVPCGDFIWMNEMNLSNIKYIGGDIVEEMININIEKYKNKNIDFKLTDLTSTLLPSVDLIICRDCLVHLSLENIYKAIENIVTSKSTYLACTTFLKNKFNYNIQDGNWRTINMEKKPFNFPLPIYLIEDFCPLDGGIYSDKALGIWKVDDIYNTM